MSSNLIIYLLSLLFTCFDFENVLCNIYFFFIFFPLEIRDLKSRLGQTAKALGQVSPFNTFHRIQTKHLLSPQSRLTSGANDFVNVKSYSKRNVCTQSSSSVQVSAELILSSLVTTAIACTPDVAPSLNISTFSNNLTINQFYLFLYIQHSCIHTSSPPTLPTIVVETWKPFH